MPEAAHVRDTTPPVSRRPERRGAATTARDWTPMIELVPFPSWRRARDRACAVLLSGETLVVVTGPSGTGKTLLLEDLARIIRSAGWRVIMQPADAPLDYDHISGGGPAVLLIDDAEQLSEADLLLLQGMRDCSVLLAGAESMERRCPGCTTIKLRPLGLDEARTFIALWLAQAGESEPVLDDAAVLRLLGLSGGIPRLLAILLGAGMWHPARESAASPDPEEVLAEPPRHAAADVRPTPNAAVPTPEPVVIGRRRLPIAAGTCLVVAIAVAAIFAPPRYWPERALPWRSMVEVHTNSLLTLLGQHVATLLHPDPTPQRVAKPVVTVQAPRTKVTEAGPIAVASNIPPPPADRIEAQREPPAPATVALVAPTLVAPTPVAPTPVALTPVALTPVVLPSVVLPSVALPLVALPSDAPTLVTQASVLTVLVARGPIPSETQALAATSMPPDPAPDVMASPPPRVDTLPPAVTEILLRRGAAMVAVGDYSAARLLFGRAAAAGNASAMLSLSRTYDPELLTGPGAAAGADPVAAVYWYRQALAAGSPAASPMLRTVEHRSND